MKSVFGNLNVLSNTCPKRACQAAAMHSAWRDSWTRFTWWAAPTCGWRLHEGMKGWSWIRDEYRSRDTRFWATGHEVHNGLRHGIDQLSWRFGIGQLVSVGAFSGWLPCQIDPNMYTVPIMKSGLWPWIARIHHANGPLPYAFGNMTNRFEDFKS